MDICTELKICNIQETIDIILEVINISNGLNNLVSRIFYCGIVQK